MSSSNKKLLISGCGFSWGRQQRKTWVNVLRATGVDLTDTGGPAVSNQWIINRAFMSLLEQHYDHVIIQITSIGKLDVEIMGDRYRDLVATDSVRSFTVDNIWPSSHSTQHPAKSLYNEFLLSPRLETQDLYCKLLMLEDWCRNRGTKLTVLQPYDIPWTDQQREGLAHLIDHMAMPLYQQYEQSRHYQHHDHANRNMVPCVEYQCELAMYVAVTAVPEVVHRLVRIQEAYLAK
jgi:hypothetical protein